MMLLDFHVIVLIDLECHLASARNVATHPSSPQKVDGCWGTSLTSQSRQHAKNERQFEIQTNESVKSNPSHGM